MRIITLVAAGVLSVATLSACGSSDSSSGANSSGGGSSGASGAAAAGGSSGNGGTSANGGTSSNGGSANGGATGTGGSPNGGGGSAARGGTGGSGTPMSARSCDSDCAALASTECAGPDFSVATCVPKCQKDAQDGIDGAIAVGCLDQYLTLDVCRANDPVCTHPNPNECVQENAAYIQCLADAAKK